MEDEIRIDSDGNLQNRDDLLQEFMAKLSTQKSAASMSKSANQYVHKTPVANQSAYKATAYESALMSELLAELEIAEFEAELRAELTLNSSSQVKLAQASQTATYSELLMYIGLSLLLFAFALRRRLAL